MVDSRVPAAGEEAVVPLQLLHARFTLTRQLNSLAGRITSNVTLEYSVLEKHAHGTGGDSFPLYTAIVRIAIG